MKPYGLPRNYNYAEDARTKYEGGTSNGAHSSKTKWKKFLHRQARRVKKNDLKKYFSR